MKHISTEQMKKLDKKTIKEFGIPSVVLMENAGREVANVAVDMFSGDKSKKIVCICGKGNNGGDGFVTVRHLLNKGFKTDIFIIERASDLKGDAKINFNILKNMKVDKRIILEENINLFKQRLKEYDLIVDAIFGIGLKGHVREPYRSIIKLLNESGKKILSVDVPSGLDATTGEVMGECIKAEKTVTFGLPKTGFKKNEGISYTGDVITADISIPGELLE
ncbi:MAG: NAD(P)H-hydrate epimerase [Elusimicrobiota bacterium]